MRIGKLFIDMAVNDAEFKEGIKQVDRELKTFSKTVASVGNKIDKVVTQSFKAATVAVTAFGAASLKTGAEFEQAITAVGAVASAAPEGLMALEEEARRLGSATLFTATQAADAMQALARANMSANEIVAASGPALMLAGGAGAEMSQATNVLASTLAQFSLSANDSMRVTDVFSVALRKSLFDITSLTEAMKFAGTVGAGFGMSLEETTAAIAQFRNLGLEGSLAGTQFRMMMARAAKPTKKAKEVLADLGLTVEQINPELTGFAEIMRAVGGAGMTTTQALEIFGQRSGAAVAALAKQFADGTTSYDELFDSLNNSAGENKKLYDEMTDTVLSQTKIAVSALEELVLTVFDTYRGPLKALMTEIGTTLQVVSEVFSRNSGAMQDSFGGVLTQLTDFLRENRIAIAAWFTTASDSFSSLISFVQGLLPYLESLARLFVLIFMVNRIYAFGTAVIAIFGALKVALELLILKVGALGAAVTVSTGGLNILIASVMAAVAAYAVLGGKLSDTEAQTERLRKAEEKLAQDREKRRQKELDAAIELHSVHATNISNARAEMAANGRLTQELDSRLKSLERLTEEQINSGLAAGDLIKVQVAGRRVVIDAATAAELETKKTHDAWEVKKAYGRTLEQTKQAQKDLSAEIAKSESYIADLNVRYEAAIKKGREQVGSVQMQAQAAREAKQASEDYLQVIADETAKISDLKVQIKDLEKKEYNLVESRKRAANEIIIRDFKRAQAATATGKADEKAAEATEKRAKAEDKLARAIEAAATKRRALSAEIDKQIMEARLSDSEEYNDLLLEQEIQAARDIYNAEISLRRAAGEDVKALEQDKAFTIISIRTRELEKVKALEREAHRFAVRSARDAEIERADEIVRIRLELARDLKEIAEFQNMSAVDQLQFQMRAIEKIEEIRRRVSNEVRSLVETENAEIIRLEQEKASALARIPEELGAERLRVGRHYNDLIRKERENLRGDAEEGQEEELTLQQRFNKAMLNLLSQPFKAGAEGRSNFLMKLRGGLDKLKSKVSEVSGKIGPKLASAFGHPFAGLREGISNIGKGFKGLGVKIGSSIGGAFTAVTDVLDTKAAQSVLRFGSHIAKNVGGAIKGAIGFTGLFLKGLVKGMKFFGKAAAAAISVGKKAAAVLTSAFSKFKDITGVSTDVVGFASDAQGQMQEREELQQQIQSGELSGSELEEAKAALAEMPATAAEAAQIAVQEMIDGALGMVSALIEAAPVIIAKLAEDIPVVMQAFVDGLPQLIDGIVQNIPKIAEAIVQMTVMVVDVLVAELPRLVQAIIEQLPMVIQGLAQAFQQLIPLVGEVISMLILAIPDIVNAILVELPNIIAAIVDSIGLIIEALATAIPQLFQVVIDNLPSIVEALVGAVIQIVAMAIEALAEIVPKLISMLPQLVTAVMEAIVLLIEQVVEMLPVIVEAVIVLIADVITAVVKAIPAIIAAVISAIPKIITSLISAIPAIVQGIVAALPKLLTAIVMLYPDLIVAFVSQLIPAIIQSIPQMMEALLIELPVALYEAAVSLAKGLGEAVSQALRKLVDFFKDVIKEIVSLGAKKTDTFGDTPHAIDVGPGGMTARFAPGDTVIAAQNPLVALKQALDAAQNKMVGGMGSVRMRPPRADLAAGSPFAAAMLQAASEMQNAFATGRGGGGDLRVTVNADGRTLDEVLYRASQRGSAPRLQRQMRRTTVAAGVHIGFDRGNYSS
jgi:TP901 family phage tail tape measure protein